MKILKQVDIISANCVNPMESIYAIRLCKKNFEFGRSVLFTDKNISVPDIETIKINKLTSVDAYNDFILGLRNYVNNDFTLIVQDDGYIVNSSLWTDEFLQYDYVGAPWPLEKEWISSQTEKQRPYMLSNLPKNRVGNGGFSLRSRKFLDFSLQFKSCEGLGEDTFLSVRNYDDAIGYGIKFAPFDLAVRFSYENPCIDFGTPWNSRIKFDKKKHFGFHGRNFVNKNMLLALKYKDNNYCNYLLCRLFGFRLQRTFC